MCCAGASQPDGRSFGGTALDHQAEYSTSSAMSISAVTCRFSRWPRHHIYICFGEPAASFSTVSSLRRGSRARRLPPGSGAAGANRSANDADTGRDRDTAGSGNRGNRDNRDSPGSRDSAYHGDWDNRVSHLQAGPLRPAAREQAGSFPPAPPCRVTSASCATSSIQLSQLAYRRARWGVPSRAELYAGRKPGAGTGSHGCAPGTRLQLQADQRALAIRGLAGHKFLCMARDSGDAPGAFLTRREAFPARWRGVRP